MADNLKVYQDLNKLLQERTSMLEKHTEEMSRQVGVQKALNAAMNDLPVDDLIGAFNRTNDALMEVISNSRDLRNTTDDLLSEFVAGAEDSVKGTNAFGKALSALMPKSKKTTALLAGVFIGFIESIKTAISMVKLAGGIISTLSGWIWEIGKAIVAIPFKVLQGLIDLSYNWWDRTKAVVQAIEDTRAALGDLNSNEGAAAKETFNNLNGAIGNTGLSIGQLFDTMRNNAEVMQHILKLATEMGPTFGKFGDEISNNAGYFIAFQKGLGLSGDQLKNVAGRAIAAGDDINDTMRQISNFSLRMGKKFGISQKLISRDLADMQGDMATFGSVGKDSMAALSVFARKLGVDFKQLLGIVNQFDDFETAAENAAKLGQAFGMNLDAVGLMMEQDVGKRVDMIRQSFAEAGQSFESMSRQERAHLSALAGVDSQIADQVFSAKNLSMSYDDIVRSSKASGKQQLTQEQATKALADSIERAVVDLEKFTSLFDAFVQGFTYGLVRTKEWNSLMKDMRELLWGVFRAAGTVARVFTKSFPGISDIFGDMGKGLDKLTASFKKTPEIFEKFFKALGDPTSARTALGNLLSDLGDTFFGDGPDGIGGFLESKGVKAFGRAIANIMASVVDFFHDGLRKVTDFLRSGLNGDFNKAFEEGMDKTDSKIRDIFGPVFDAISDLFKDEQLWADIKDVLFDAVTKLFDTALDMVGEYFKNNPGKAALIIGYIFGPAMIKGMISGGVGTLVAEGLKKLLLNSTATATAGATPGLLTTIGGWFTGLAAAINPAVWIAAAAAAVGGAAAAMSIGMDKWGDEFQKKYGETEGKMGASFAGLIDMLTFGMFDDETIKSWGEAIAGFSQTAFGLLEKVFGKFFTSSLKNAISSGLDVFDGLGEALRGIFTLDVDAIKGGFSKMLSGLVEFAFDFIIARFPAMVVGIATALTKVISGAMTILSGLFYGLGDAVGKIPWIGPFLKTIVDGFGLASEAIGWLFGEAGKLLADFDVNWTAVWNTSVEFLKFIWGKITGTVTKTLEWFASIPGKIGKFFSEGWETIKNTFANANIGKFIVDGLKSALFGPVEAVLSEPFKNGLGKVLNVLGIHSPSKETESMGQHLVDGLKRGLDGVPGLFKDAGGDMLSGLSKSVTGYKELFLQPTATAITEMVSAVAGIDKELSQIKDINLQTKLENLGKIMGVNMKDFEIKSERVNITINLEVKMDAEELTTKLEETKRLVTTGR